MGQTDGIGALAQNLLAYWNLGEMNNLTRDWKPWLQALFSYGYNTLTNYLSDNALNWFGKSSPLVDTKTVVSAALNAINLNSGSSVPLNNFSSVTSTPLDFLTLLSSSIKDMRLKTDLALQSKGNPAQLMTASLDILKLQDSMSDSATSATSIGNGTKLSGVQLGMASGAGALAGMGVGYGLNAGLGKAFGNSEGGLFASLLVSNVGSQIAGNVATTAATNIAGGMSAGANIGANLANMFSNAGSLTSFGAAAANIAMDVFDKRRKAKWESGVNLGLTALSFVPGLNIAAPIAQVLFNGVGHLAGGSIEKGFNVDNDILNKASTYGGSIKNALNSKNLSGEKYTFWANHDRHNDEKDFYEGRRLYDAMSSIVTDNLNKLDMAAGNLAITLVEDNYRASGGYSQLGTHMGKQGMSIQPKPERTTIKLYTSIKLTKPTEEFKEGGSISNITRIKLVLPVEEFKEGGQFNVIPEGALHARLHHMENDENITKKGIPVVSEREGGEIEQLAEIERQEIIFRLEVTKNLEDLLRKYNSDEYTLKEKDEFALEAGKLLVEEILYNTIDNTNSLI